MLCNAPVGLGQNEALLTETFNILCVLLVGKKKDAIYIQEIFVPPTQAVLPLRNFGHICNYYELEVNIIRLWMEKSDFYYSDHY